jgi:hypothetical protein
LTSTGAPCAACDATATSALAAARRLDLDRPARAPHRSARRGPERAVDVAIDLAFDPREASGGAAFWFAAGSSGGGAARGELSASNSTPPIETPIDHLEADVHLLADYGETPKYRLLSPFYTWRVIVRRRVLERALALRREEVRRAHDELEDALVAFAAETRATAEARPEYADALGQLRRAEDALRSRDEFVAAENDAHATRLASVDARIFKLEGDRDRAIEEERAAAAQLAAAQSELNREEARCKHAEAELRAAQQREAAGTRR